MSLIGLRVGPFEIIGDASVPEPGDWFLARRAGLTRRQPSEVLVKVVGPDAPAEERTAAQRQFELLRGLDDARVPDAVAFYEGTGAMALERVVAVPIRALMQRPSAERDAVGLATWLDVVLDLAATLQHAHNKGIVHGHLDGDTVQIAGDGAVVVWGFGAPDRPRQPGWVPPECAREGPVTAATDQWALGGVLSALLTARAPWAGPDPAADARAGDPDAVVSSVEAQWPALGRALRRLLDPSPANRFATVQAARTELLALSRQADGRSERRELGVWASRVLRDLRPPTTVVPPERMAEPYDDEEPEDDAPTVDGDAPLYEPPAVHSLPDDLGDDLSDALEPDPAETADVSDDLVHDEAASADVSEDLVPMDEEATVLYDQERLAREAARVAPQGDQEATVLFTDRQVQAELHKHDGEVDTDINKRLPEAVFHQDDEDSLEQSIQTSSVPLPDGDLDEPSLGSVPPMAVPPPEPVAKPPPVLYDDEESGPYHIAIDLTEIDTAPNPPPGRSSTLPPRPMSPPERLASGMLAGLAALMLVWFLSRVLF